jgi:hypothetical protein
MAIRSVFSLRIVESFAGCDRELSYSGVAACKELGQNETYVLAI